MRPRRRFGMVLDAEQWVLAVPHALQRAIVEVDVRRLDVWRQGIGITAKPWFCVVISTRPVSRLSTG